MNKTDKTNGTPENKVEELSRSQLEDVSGGAWRFFNALSYVWPRPGAGQDDDN